MLLRKDYCFCKFSYTFQSSENKQWLHADHQISRHFSSPTNHSRGRMPCWLSILADKWSPRLGSNVAIPTQLLCMCNHTMSIPVQQFNTWQSKGWFTCSRKHLQFCGLVFSVMELRTVLWKDFWFFCCWIVVLLCCCCRQYCFSCCWWWWCCCCCYCCCCCGLLLLLLLLLLFLFLLLLLFLVLVLVFEWQWKKNELQRWSLFRGLHGAPFMKRQGKGPTVDFTTPTKNIKKFQPEKSKNWIKGPFHTFPTSW